MSAAVRLRSEAPQWRRRLRLHCRREHDAQRLFKILRTVRRLLAVKLALNFSFLLPPKNPPPAPARPTNEPSRETSPGVFQIGDVRLDKARREITFSAAVNMRGGVIEHLLVTGPVMHDRA